MAEWGADGRRSGLPSEAQHRCGGTKSTGFILGFGSHLGISAVTLAVTSAVTCGSHILRSHVTACGSHAGSHSGSEVTAAIWSAVICDRLRQSHRQS
jgi:hypothetical protein